MIFSFIMLAGKSWIQPLSRRAESQKEHGRGWSGNCITEVEFERALWSEGICDRNVD